MNGQRPPPTVLKIGGSLLDLPDLGVRILAFLERENLVRPVLVAGGGGAADLVREWDRIHGLGEERSHRLALEAMDLNGRLLAGILTGGRIARDRTGLARAWEDGAIPVLEVRAFLEAEEPGTSGASLPHLWTATSDSVAAFVAARLGADLTLAKSAPPPPGSLADLARLGYVDEHFPRLAREIARIGAVDLRNPTLSLRALT